MREGDFCYFHSTLRRRHRPLAGKPDSSTLRPVCDPNGKLTGMEPLDSPSGGIELGLLEDTASVQVAISTVINALASNRLEVRRATALLYGLQLAASNCRNLRQDGPADPERMLRQTVTNADDEPIAHPGLNNNQRWAHADAPDAFARTPAEEKRQAAQENTLDEESLTAEDLYETADDEEDDEDFEDEDDGDSGGEEDQLEEEDEDETDVDEEADEDEARHDNTRNTSDEELDDQREREREADEEEWNQAFSVFRARVLKELGPYRHRFQSGGAAGSEPSHSRNLQPCYLE